MSNTMSPGEIVLDTMPRPGPRRPITAVRLSTDGLKFIDRRAEQEGVNRSEMIRRMLAYAAQNMPKGWKP